MIAVKESKPEFNFITLRDCPSLRDRAAEWFHEKWGVPADAYLKCMTAYLKRETEYGWYLCLSGEQIVGGLGIIENDFHDRKDLTPNVCAVYTEEACRCQGVAGQLLNMVVEDLQTMLSALGYLDPSRVDGNYGALTAQAVRDFQTATGREPTGIANHHTQDALRALYWENYWLDDSHFTVREN